MFDASPEEYVPWLADAFAPRLPSSAAAADALTDAEVARLRFYRWLFAQRRAATEAPASRLLDAQEGS